MKARIWAVRSVASAVVFAAIAGTAAAQTQPGAPPAATSPVARVNGEAVTQAELEAVLKQQPPSATPPTEIQRRQMQLEAVGMLIDDRLLVQYLRSNGPRVEEKDIAGQLTQLETNLKAQGKTLQDFYRDHNLSPIQLRQSVVNMLQWVGYVNSRISEDQLKQYYEANRDYFEGVTVRASHIVLRIPATGSDSERQASRAKLQNLRQEILAGTLDFALAAKKQSQCATAPAGGDLGYFPRKFAVDEAFARAAFALKVGEVSDVVQSDYGLHLIKATDRKAGQPVSFDKIKDVVREVAAEEMRQALLAQQRKTSKIEICLDGTPALKKP